MKDQTTGEEGFETVDAPAVAALPSALRRLIDALQENLSDDVIHWGTDRIPALGGFFLADSLDVFHEGLCEAAGLNWLWTIEVPNTSTERAAPVGSPTTLRIVLPADVALWVVTSATVPTVDMSLVIVTAIEDEPRPRQWDRLNELAAARDGDVVRHDGWSESAVHAALHHWVSEHAGVRRRFHFNQSVRSPFLEGLARVSSRAERHEEETYRLGEFVRVSSVAFDQLLALGPEVAAELTAPMNDRAAQRHARTRDGAGGCDGDTSREP